MLKYINVVLHAAVVILAMLYAGTVSEGAASAADVVGTPYQVTLVTMMGVAGVAALVSAIVTAVVLFKLKGEISDKLA